MSVAADAPPETGEIVRVRSRRYLVEGVVPPPQPEHQTLVHLSCLEDDAEGEELSVLWEKELDAERMTGENWAKLAQGQFDDPRHFAAYYHTLRWNTVTATDPTLFQAPYRAGIKIDAYQLEPLRKALLLPRVNLFIADDVGLGKTIEAGLIVRELLMRQRIRRIVVAAPPSVVLQWKDELDQRFGLTFVVFDRDFVRRMRQERGFAINPWTTHSRFIISHRLLRDEDYASPLRDWLGKVQPSPQSLLILDEAHNAAPASGARYAIDSQFTRSIRELAPLFEHRLFLSATPHNGHSNSFSSLLEILDPQRFCRGVPVEAAKQLEPVMVRRLKEDLRLIQGGLPKRLIVEVPIEALKAEDPELLLPQLLDEYREARKERLQDAPKGAQTAAQLVLCNLQKRLLSSIEAFALTLKVHRKAFEKAALTGGPGLPSTSLGTGQSRPMPAEAKASALRSLLQSPGADDDEADDPEEDVSAEESAAMESATAASVGTTRPDALARERALLAQMTEAAETARGKADARVRHLVDWCKKNPGKRVLVFTEYADTKRYLEKQLRAALTPGQDADPRIATFHGGMPDDTREDIKRAFNADPATNPLRVLIATDAAREGVNLQNHCADLFHFDVPWNPSRLEQRNGRIDRKLQRAEEVRCHYFVYTQRPEDRVLKALVTKSKTIREQLGSLAPVLERKLEVRLSGGISRQEAAALARSIESDQLDGEQTQTAQSELEDVRVRDQNLRTEIASLQGLLAKSKDWLRLNIDDLRQAISSGLSLLHLKPLTNGAKGEYRLPEMSDKFATDPSWMRTLDTLRAPRRKGQPDWEWRREQPIRPVVFEDQGALDAKAVHLHLEHRFVQRLLGRFRSQGFVHNDLSRVCVAFTDDPVARVVLLGRISLYGERASRLHDQVLAVTAKWVDADIRKGALEPEAEVDRLKTLELLEKALASEAVKTITPQVRQRLASAARADLDQLLPQLKKLSDKAEKDGSKSLATRGQKEAREMREILESQRKRILATQKKREAQQLPLLVELEKKQLDADKRHWQERLEQLEHELESEPQRIRDSYDVKAPRFEPVGLVYLWPITG